MTGMTRDFHKSDEKVLRCSNRAVVEHKNKWYKTGGIRKWYQKKVDEEIKGVDCRDKVKHNEMSDQLFLELG